MIYNRENKLAEELNVEETSVIMNRGILHAIWIIQNEKIWLPIELIEKSIQKWNLWNTTNASSIPKEVENIIVHYGHCSARY